MPQLSKQELTKRLRTLCSHKTLPPAVQQCCEVLLTCLQAPKLEVHAVVCATRDVASRYACTACLDMAPGNNYAACPPACFALCDACDSYCHQRCSLPEMLRLCQETKAEMRCAFKQGPRIPGSVAFKEASKVTKPCCVYCANSACGAGREYAAGLPVEHREYPGGLLEYHCRSLLDCTLPKIKGFAPANYLHRACADGCTP